MYYCVYCKTVHSVHSSGDSIFTTGFYYYNSEKIAAGLCARPASTIKPDYKDQLLGSCRKPASTPSA